MQFGTSKAKIKPGRFSRRLRSFFQGGRSVSAAQPMDVHDVQPQNESQMVDEHDRSTKSEDLNLKDWPLEDSFKPVSNFLDTMPSNSQDTEPERSMRTPSPSSVWSSKRSSLHEASIQFYQKQDQQVEALEQQMDEMSIFLAQGTLRREKLLAQMQSINAEVQAHLTNADINVSNDVKSEPLTPPTKDMGVDPISLDKTTMGIADTLPEYHAGENGWRERNLYSSDTKNERISISPSTSLLQDSLSNSHFHGTKSLISTTKLLPSLLKDSFEPHSATSNAGMKPSGKFQRHCFLLKGGEGTSAAQPIDEPASIPSNNATMGIAHTSPEDHTVRGRLLESNHGTDDPKDELISPEKLKFTEAIFKAMAKELAPLISNRDQTAVRPTLYRGSKDGTVEEWLLVMKRYLERVYSNASPIDKAWAIIDHLGDEARSFIINKPESERDSHEKVTTLLSSRFGTGSNRWPVRQAFRLRNQLEKEGLMQYLDALEGLRSQGFPDEPITTRRYEILHRFMDGVSDSVLQRELTVVFATEAYLADPPTVESLRFTVQELQRSRHQQQPRDPGCTETVPYQYLQSDQVPGSPVAPQHESLPPLARRSARLPMPAASVHTTLEYRQTATLEQSAHCLQSACARRKLVVHRPEHILDPHGESQQGAAAVVPAPAVPVTSCTTEVSPGCPTLSIQSETSSPRAEEKKKTDATQTLSTASGRVLMLRPADQATVNAPLTVTCGTKQVQTGLESTTFDPSGRTLLSVHLVLASEQQIRPDLTLEKLKLELASNSAVKKISLPLPKEWYTEGEASTCTAYTPVPVHANIDGVDMKFDASVVVDVFPQGVCLGPHELRCYSISKQEPTGEARIDERASLVVSFAVPDASPIPLRGMVDTGSGVSIMSFSAFNRVALRTGVALQPYRIDLYAANGKTIKTFGIAERVRFQLGGYELETNFVVVDDAHGLEDFLLGRNFLRTYNVLVDLTSMKIVVRAPAKPVWHHAHAQTSDEALSSTVVLDQDVVLQPFERAVLRAKLVTSNLEAFAFSNVVINFATPNRLLKNTIFVEDTIATVGETGSFYVSVGNLTSNAQKVKCGTMLGTAAPVRLVYQAVPQSVLAHKGESDEKSDSPNEFVNRVYSEMDLNSHSRCSSSSEFEFLSSTDPSEEGLSEREIRKRTDPDLLAPIPGPESQLEEVQKLWGKTARDSLNNILTEFDDLFMKHKADIGRCTIAKHPVELEPGATPHREGARRMP